MNGSVFGNVASHTRVTGVVKNHLFHERTPSRSNSLQARSSNRPIRNLRLRIYL